jgi:hypothetical protein
MGNSENVFTDGKSEWEGRPLRIDYPNGLWCEMRGILLPAYFFSIAERDTGSVLCISLTDEPKDIVFVLPVAKVTDSRTGELLFDPRDELSLKKMAPSCRQFMEDNPKWSNDLAGPEEFVN